MGGLEMGKSLFPIVLIFYLFFGSADADVTPMLDYRQSEVFRASFVRIIAEQLRHGPWPRWFQRDCAGLVRFAVYETFKPHDEAWLRANGISERHLPREVILSPDQKIISESWRQIRSDERSAYASAIVIIQENSRFISKDMNQALPGDMLFFDQGDDQHLMIWMGSYIAYHTGRETEKNTGLRKYSLNDFMNWKDTRWQPRFENPNFIGIYRFSFLMP